MSGSYFFVVSQMHMASLRIPSRIWRASSASLRASSNRGCFASRSRMKTIASRACARAKFGCKRKPSSSPVWPRTTGHPASQIMAAVLTWVTATKSGVLGFIYLFVFSLGMCTLLVLVGLFSGTVARLPRAGAWMVWIKRIFALIMLAVAEYYLVQMGLLLI